MQSKNWNCINHDAHNNTFNRTRLAACLLFAKICARRLMWALDAGQAAGAQHEQGSERT